MNTKYFDSVLEVARTRNFNRAAENLFITQPALTYQINAVEEEIGFRIFDRSGKGASLTPAGEQFIMTLRDITAQLKRAVEQGQNFAFKYRDNIRISLMVRAAIYYLPELMNIFNEREPSVSITPYFDYYHSVESFLRGEQDILFAVRDSIRQIPDLNVIPLFDSRIYLVVLKDDELAKKKIITEKDLEGRTLMVGGGSPPALRAVQQRLIKNEKISYFNSNDHDTSITYLSTGKSVVLSPGFLNDHNARFTWIPFDCKETIPCVLCTHASDKRKTVQQFVQLIVDYYSRIDNV
ncbi:MAG: LysR family transcriptional regulator [Erysipelotrichaceae bacterium]|nr:LysR family transcriptional regulator [Erysipelotrichaceae bacterium]